MNYDNYTVEALKELYDKKVQEARQYFDENTHDGYLYEPEDRVYTAMMEESRKILEEIFRRSASGLNEEAESPVVQVDTATPEEVVEPPVGIMPRWMYDGQRILDICSAIGRYLTHTEKMEIPEEWTDELFDRIIDWNLGVDKLKEKQ